MSFQLVCIWTWVDDGFVCRTLESGGTMNRHTGLETERLILREATMADAEAIYRYMSDPVVMRLTGEPMWESLEETRERIRTFTDYEVYGYGRWQVFEKHLGDKAQSIGFAGLKFHERFGPGGADEVDLGYRFLEDRWGRGYATECGQALIRFGFEVLKLQQITAYTLPENVASQRVLEKLDFIDDGLHYFDDYGFEARRYFLNAPESSGSEQT